MVPAVQTTARTVTLASPRPSPSRAAPATARTSCSRRARARRHHRLRRGRAGRLLGRDGGVDGRVRRRARCGACSATTRFDLEGIGARLAEIPGHTGAKMALDGALHDWIGQARRPARLAAARRLDGDDAADVVHDRHRHRRGHRRQDPARGPLRRAEGEGRRRGRPRPAARDPRAVSDATLRIDGNEGWTLDTARELMPALLDLGVEFVEQPFPADDLDSYHAAARAAGADPGRDRRGLQGSRRASRRSRPTPTGSTSSSRSAAASARRCA